ncbi:elongation factor P [Hypericibacter sp.]|uniref:elongation factor P n=1 Tax=Hypericibacter sp. TaxID=2705401 RepID=UPI003D6D646B
MKLKGNEIRGGNVIEHNGRLWRVAKINIVQMGNWRSYLQAELRDIRDGTKVNERFGSGDVVEKVQLEEKDYQYLFQDGDEYTFMDSETFEQITLNEEAVGETHVYLQENMTVSIQSYEGAPLSVTLPGTVIMTITEADPVVKGQTASSSYKPAKLENGVRILVPPHIGAGTRVVVNTTDSSYVERAKD